MKIYVCFKMCVHVHVFVYSYNMCTRLRKAHNAKRQADKTERDKVLKRTQDEHGNTSDEEDSEDTCDMMGGYVSIFCGLVLCVV